MTTHQSRPHVAVIARWPVGGIRTWMRYVYANDAFRRYRLSVFVPAGPETATLGEDLSPFDIEVVLGRNTSAWFTVDVARFLLSRRRLKLVHSHGFAAGAMATPSIMLRGAKHLVSQHDVLLDRQFRTIRGNVTRALIAFGLRHATLVHSVSGSAAENLRRNFPGIAEQRLRVVRNGIDTRRFSDAEPVDVRSRFGIPADTFIIGFFGRFMGQKGFKYLVEAIKAMTRYCDTPSPVVLAVGGGGFRAEEERRVKSMGLDRHFRFVDFTPEVAGLIKGVDVVAMPSLWEACPLLAMEVLTAGTPLVGFDCPAMLELAPGTPVRLAPLGDAKALEHALLAEMRNPSKEQAAAWASANRFTFDVGEGAAQIAAVYEEMVGHG